MSVYKETFSTTKETQQSNWYITKRILSYKVASEHRGSNLNGSLAWTRLNLMSSEQRANIADRD